MKSRFDSSRIFNAQHGWYVVMRESDKKTITSTKFNKVGNQYVMGPFAAKAEVEDWLDGYLAVHSEDRPDDYIEPPGMTKPA